MCCWNSFQRSRIFSFLELQLWKAGNLGLQIFWTWLTWSSEHVVLASLWISGSKNLEISFFIWSPLTRFIMSSNYNFVVNDKDMRINIEGKNGRREYVEKASFSLELLEHVESGQQSGFLCQVFCSLREESAYISHLTYSIKLWSVLLRSFYWFGVKKQIKIMDPVSLQKRKYCISAKEQLLLCLWTSCIYLNESCLARKQKFWRKTVSTWFPAHSRKSILFWRGFAMSKVKLERIIKMNRM